MLETVHPLIGTKERNFRQVIGDTADFLSQEYRHWVAGYFDVHSIPLQLLDALGEELVVVNERPKVAPPLVVRGWFDPRVLARLRLPPGSTGLPELRARASIDGVGSVVVLFFAHGL